MNRTARTLGLAVAGATLTLAGCSTGGDGDAPRAGSPTTPQSVSDVPGASTASTPSTASGDGLSPLRRIPPKIRRTALHSRVTDLSMVPRTAWLPGRSSDLTITERVLPGCDDRTSMSVAVDRDVLDFGWRLTHLPHGYTVARQLTIYPSVAAARLFTAEAGRAPIGCRTGLLDGRSIGAASRTAFGPDRFFGVRDHHDGTAFSEGQVTNDRRAATYIDVVTREANVVVLTRVLNADYAGSDVIVDKARNPEFVAVVRREGTASAHVLDAFR